MSYITTISPELATGEVLELYRRQQGSQDYLPNYARVFCYRPKVMQAWAGLQRELRSELDAKTFGLVTLAAALAIRSSYCALAHAGKLMRYHYTEREMLAIARGDEESPLSAAEKLMMAMAARVAADSGSVSQADIDALRLAGFSDARIFDIVAVAAARCFFAKIPDALGVQPDAALGNMNSALRELLSVGRPVAGLEESRVTQ
jgi:uncharacterized peroxidase-related enzyme